MSRAFGGRRASGQKVVALLGLFGVGNIGNEASLRAGIEAVRRRAPDCDIVVAGAITDIVASQHGVPAVSLTTGGRMPMLWTAPRVLRVALRPFAEPVRWYTTYRFVRSVDAVIVPGTGILDDFGVTPQQTPYDLFRWSVACRLARRPLSMIGVGAGPIEHPLSRWLLRRAAVNARAVSYRDEVSRAFMESIGVPSPASFVQPDVVFALARPDDRRRERSAGSSSDWHVGLGLMAYRGWRAGAPDGEHVLEQYTTAMTEVAARLLSDGHTLRLLVGEDGDSTAVVGFTESLRTLAGDAALERISVEPIRTFEDLLGQVACTDAVIATRFHNVVASLMMARPTISIGYAEKNRDLMSAFGLGRYCHRIECIDPGQVVADAYDALAQGHVLEVELQEINRRYVDRLEARFDDMIDLG